MAKHATRRSIVGGMATTLIAELAHTSKTSGQSAPKPNIIVILADDLGYADVSAYKSNRFPTPNIDRIGSEGARFTDGYSTAPVCCPSRAGLMTGRYQQRFGFEFNNGGARRDLRQGLGLSTNEITMARLLSDAGYHTGAIGKWHLGSQDQFYPTNRGFDEFVGFLPGETSYIDPHQAGVHLSFGRRGDDVLTSGRAAARTFDRHPLNQIVEGADRTVVHNEDQYLTDYFADRAADFIQRSAQPGKPYFLYVAFNAVHAPHMVTQPYYDRFSSIQDHQLRVYAGMIAALDDAVGRILAAVESSGTARNTMIIFAADHGCAMYFPGLCSCQPLRGGKLSHYEGGVRVPFMLRWPDRIKAGLIYREPVSLLDVLPTALTAAGGTLPNDRAYDGVDLLPYVTGAKSGPPHEILFWRRKPLFSVRQGDWKLWETDDPSGVYGNYKLLFNLKDDLNEATNLAASNPDKVKELEARILEWNANLIDPKWPTKNTVTFDLCGEAFTLPV